MITFYMVFVSFCWTVSVYMLTVYVKITKLYLASDDLTNCHIAKKKNHVSLSHVEKRWGEIKVWKEFLKNMVKTFTKALKFSNLEDEF